MLYGVKFAPVYTVLLLLIASRAVNDSALILAGFVRVVASPLAALPVLALMLVGKVLFILWYPRSSAMVLALGVLFSGVIGCVCFGVQTLYRVKKRRRTILPKDAGADVLQPENVDTVV
jgi:hypothetical protein